MSTKLIELGDGILVEVEVEPNQARPISGGAAEKVLGASSETIAPILVRVSQPILSACEQINQGTDLEQAEVELSLSFESEGNIYLAKASTSANINIKLIIKPRTG